MKSGRNICYYSNGKGRWLRREWKPQCSSRVFLYGRCQGVKGHKGVHWCYSPSGDFQWDDNDDDPKRDGCAGSTPPDHKDYIAPGKMDNHYFLSHFTDTQVTDRARWTCLRKAGHPKKALALTGR
jgi:hypothetical protein